MSDKLTIEQWNAMSIRQRDALVAERVMGKRVPTEQQMFNVAKRVWETQPSVTSFFELGGFYARINDEDFECVPRVLAFTTDHNAAALVVEQMQKDGLSLRLDQLGLMPQTNWEARFFRHPADMWHGVIQNPFYAQADTMPEAICLAALRAKGVL